MCGRFTQISSPIALARRFNLLLDEVPPVKTNFNIAPSRPVLAVLHDNNKRAMNYFNWGLIPSWAKDPSIGNCMINARAETVSDKPVFRGPFKNSRCLITADGFFEWKKSGSSKQPYFIRMKSKEPFGFAGLWSHWMSPDGSEIKSCSIITTSSNSLMRTIHDRTPVIMDKTNEDEWLDTKVFNKNHLLDMLKPCDIDLLEIYPISTYVNSPSNNSQQCIERIVKN